MPEYVERVLFIAVVVTLMFYFATLPEYVPGQ